MGIEQIRHAIKCGEYNLALDLIENRSEDKALALTYKSRIYELTGRFDEALVLADEAIGLASSTEEHVAAAVAKAYGLWRVFKFNEGHTVLNTVEDKVDETSKNQLLLRWSGTFFNIRGLLYWKAGDLENAKDNFEHALEIRKSLKDSNQIAYTLNNLGNTYLKMGDLKKAETFYSKSKRLRELLANNPALAASYNSYGRLEDARGNHEDAKEYHMICLELWNEVGNKQFIAKSYRFLAINASHLNQMEKFQQYIQKSDELFKEIGNTYDINTNLELKNKFTQ